MKSVKEKDLKFKITNISSERSPYGMTTIKAVEEETGVEVRAVVPNCSKHDRSLMREEFIKDYKTMTKVSKIPNDVEIGEVL